jgi:hypothetical protein
MNAGKFLFDENVMPLLISLFLRRFKVVNKNGRHSTSSWQAPPRRRKEKRKAILKKRKAQRVKPSALFSLRHCAFAAIITCSPA